MGQSLMFTIFSFCGPQTLARTVFPHLFPSLRAKEGREREEVVSHPSSVSARAQVSSLSFLGARRTQSDGWTPLPFLSFLSFSLSRKRKEERRKKGFRNTSTDPGPHFPFFLFCGKGKTCGPVVICWRCRNLFLSFIFLLKTKKRKM